LTDVEFREGLDPALLSELLALYAREWWTNDRDAGHVERMLEGSDLVLSAVSPQGALVGFARAITDGVYRATIFDVIVHPDWREHGIGGELIRRAHDHPALAGCRRIELICLEEMVPWYERFGYEVAAPEHLRMVWRRPDWD
jgi:predicted N-acetyltransferase YhbS